MYWLVAARQCVPRCGVMVTLGRRPAGGKGVRGIVFQQLEQGCMQWMDGNALFHLVYSIGNL